MRVRLHFEPEDIVVDNLEQVPAILNKIRQYITVRKILPIDKDGFPVDMKVWENLKMY